jgi:hypothetical protein
MHYIALTMRLLLALNLCLLSYSLCFAQDDSTQLKKWVLVPAEITESGVSWQNESYEIVSDENSWSIGEGFSAIETIKTGKRSKVAGNKIHLGKLVVSISPDGITWNRRPSEFSAAYSEPGIDDVETNGITWNRKGITWNRINDQLTPESDDLITAEAHMEPFDAVPQSTLCIGKRYLVPLGPMWNEVKQGTYVIWAIDLSTNTVASQPFILELTHR